MNVDVPRLALIFTTFPALTETFVQREVEGLRKQGVRLELFSLWGGSTNWNGERVHCYHLWELVSLPYWLCYWALRRPGVVRDMSSRLFGHSLSGILNFAENLLGMGFGLLYARRFERMRSVHLHGVWATAPAAAAWLIHRLTDAPFSFGGHAYDLFQNGGDGLLMEKQRDAEWVRVSTRAAARHLARLGVPEKKILTLYRSLPEIPPRQAIRPHRDPLRLLSVGRLVEKMGMTDFVDYLAQWRRQGLNFEACIIGDGPESGRLVARIRAKDLGDCVTWAGAQPFAKVEEALQWADFFVFCGKVARNGDRAGFPNALAEAMAWGVPVVTRTVGGVAEAIRHGTGGILMESPDALAQLKRASTDDEFYQLLRDNARDWVSRHFDLERNISAFIARTGLEKSPRPNLGK